MAPSSFAVVLSVLVCCSAVESSPRVIRSEPSQVSLDAGGKMQREVNKHSHHEEPSDKAKSEMPCNLDFKLGEAGTVGCEDTIGHHTEIKSPAMCIFAANMSGAKSNHDSFLVGPTRADEMKHPKGCFEFDCEVGQTGRCYYYNDVPVTPDKNLTDFGGIPVCQRPMYVKGEKDSADVLGGCPDEYQVMDSADQGLDEKTCQNAGMCLGDEDAAEFRVGTKNASEHLLHPIGCLFDNVLGEVFYNQRTALPRAADLVVQGTPICHPKEKLHCTSTCSMEDRRTLAAAATSAASGSATVAAAGTATGAAAGAAAGDGATTAATDAAATPAAGGPAPAPAP